MHGDQSKLTVCKLKEVNRGNWELYWAEWIKQRKSESYWASLDSQGFMKSILEQNESIFLTRLPEETIRGIMNFEKAAIPGTPDDQIVKALVS